MNRYRRRVQHHRGVSLVEMAVILVLLGLLVILAVAVVPVLTERMRLDRSEVTIREVNNAIVSFAASQWRLPCPDVDGDGIEGSGGTCGAGNVVGFVPYRSLGFPDPVLDESHIPIRYAVYRNIDGTLPADADLVTLGDRFIPKLPGDPPTLQNSAELLSEGVNPTPKAIVPPNLNDLDFCLAIRNAKNAAADAAYAYTEAPPDPLVNSAYILVSGGVENADETGDDVPSDIAFDGINEDAAPVDEVGFESPTRRRGIGYDDVVFAMPFDLLESKLSCAAVTVAVNAGANLALATAHMVAGAEDLNWLAERETVMDDMAVAQAGFDVALSVFQSLAAGADLAVSIASSPCAPLADNTSQIPLNAFNVGVSLVNIGLAAAGLDLAIQQTALNDAIYAATQADVATLTTLAAEVCADAIDLDTRGGQP